MSQAEDLAEYYMACGDIGCRFGSETTAHTDRALLGQWGEFVRKLLVTFVLSTCSASQASIVVTSATVSHVFSGSAGWNLATTTPLNNASPGKHFDTSDGYAGAILDIGATSGSLRLNAWSSSDAGLPSPYGSMSISALRPTGTIRFTSTDGGFTIAGGMDSDSPFSAGTYLLTHLGTGQSREIKIGGLYASPGYTNQGTLSWPAPVGDYELVFSTSQGSFNQSTRSGSTWINFAITPEPATCLWAITFAAKRRRR
jgi:hypothetical protein